MSPAPTSTGAPTWTGGGPPGPVGGPGELGDEQADISATLTAYTTRAGEPGRTLHGLGSATSQGYPGSDRSSRPASKSRMGREAGTAIDPDCYAALEHVLKRAATESSLDVPAVREVPALSEDYHQAA